MRKLFLALSPLLLAAFNCQTSGVQSNAQQVTQFEKPISVSLPKPFLVSCGIVGDVEDPRIVAPLFGGQVHIISYNKTDRKLTAAPVAVNLDVAYDSVIADINSDGRNEIIVATSGAGSVELFESKLKNSKEEFFRTSLAKGLKTTYGIGVGDVNNDGRIDVATTEFDGNKISLLTNKGGKSFELSSVSAATRGPQTVKFADIDSNGNLDLITTARSGNRVYVHFNDGSSGFSDVAVSTEIQEPNLAVPFDVDGDSNVDVLVASRKSSFIYLIRNVGNRQFEKPKVLVSSVAGTYSILPLDVDGDEQVDLITASITKGIVSVHFNDANAKFRTEVLDRDFPGAVALATCDLNQDQKLDLVASGSNINEVRVYLRK